MVSGPKSAVWPATASSVAYDFTAIRTISAGTSFSVSVTARGDAEILLHPLFDDIYA